MDLGSAKWSAPNREKGFLYFFASLEELSLCAAWRGYARGVAKKVRAHIESRPLESTQQLSENILRENLYFGGAADKESWVEFSCDALGPARMVGHVPAHGAAPGGGAGGRAAASRGFRGGALHPYALLHGAPRPPVRLGPGHEVHGGVPEAGPDCALARAARGLDPRQGSGDVRRGGARRVRPAEPLGLRIHGPELRPAHEARGAVRADLPAPRGQGRDGPG